MSSLRSTLAVLGLRLVVMATVTATALAPALAQELTCPQTSDPTDWAGATLDSGTPVKDGIVYDGNNTRLRLENAAGVFRSTALGISDLTVFAAVADFDRDGWDDFVGVGEATEFVRIYRNRTTLNLGSPQWDNPDWTATPRFDMVRTLRAANSVHRWRPTAAADFNGDGWPDVFVADADTYNSPSVATMWLNQASNDTSGNPRFLSGYSAMSTPSDLGAQNWGGTNVMALDYNGDRKIDLLVGSASSSNGGTIRVFLNNCTLRNPLPSPLPAAGLPLPCASTSNPRFVYSSTLSTNMGYGSGQGSLPVFAYEDVDGDGRRDLISGAPSCCSSASQRLRLWKGTSNGGLATTAQSITFPGGATTILVSDFSGDGLKDLIVGTDNWNYNSGNGGSSYYWVNNGTGTPFSGASQQLTTYNPSGLYDFDVGFVFNYDHDPANTPDVMVADGNHTSNFYVLANRVVPQFVECGEVASGILSLGDLADSEMVVTAARIDASFVLNGGDLDFYMSNEEPANWVAATSCGDGSDDYCASFQKPVGRDVRWKAMMCSNTAHTTTPTLSTVRMSFDYTEAEEHFRAGVVVHDGVAYAGGFRQPGYRGHMFAVNAGLSQTYWDASTAIDAVADSSRNIYTANVDGTARIDFSASAASTPGLQATLQVTSEEEAEAVISWVRSARFGVGNVGISQSRLGAIETSTPALLIPPSVPNWYVYATTIDRQKHLQFQQSYANRRKLLLFGSKDGMIHAIQTNPSAITTSPSGHEAWAFIPAKTAAGMLADYTASLGGDLLISSYPDGSPTLADFKKSDGSFATVALVSSGNGGQSVAAIDVTNTVNASTGAVIGPTPLWTGTPGGGDAGQGYSKPAVARVKIGSAERYVAVVATGLGRDNPAAPWVKGRVVAGYDIATGELLWQFRAACPITSDIVVFETDDELEPNDPAINGYIDRAVFADMCGNLYKLDPAKDLDGGWNDNRDYGEFEVEDISGVKQVALFSSDLTSGALGAEAPIAGTVAARADNTSRVVLFFGTGGLESHEPSTPNEFYAVYADTGEIRSKHVGTCSGGACEKYYGGVVVTPEQVIFSRTIDPVVGSQACDLGTTVLQAMDLNAGSNGEFTEDFSQSLSSALMGAVYGDAGAIYFATLGGEISRIGTPRSSTAGGDSSLPSGSLPTYGTGSENEGGPVTIGTTEPLTLLGWRQVY